MSKAGYSRLQWINKEENGRIVIDWNTHKPED